MFAKKYFFNGLVTKTALNTPSAGYDPTYPILLDNGVLSRQALFIMLNNDHVRKVLATFDGSSWILHTNWRVMTFDSLARIAKVQLQTKSGFRYIIITIDA